MLKFLLGVLVGAVAAAQYQRRRHTYTSEVSGSGRVDELSTAAQNIPRDPTINAGDGTPGSKVRTTDEVPLTS